ncbi:MAG: hypothetical protein NUK65_02945 [Firmicutes bacterium]|nr:hypothetical protein [Bacillota bacterium]
MSESKCDHPELKPNSGKCSDEQVKKCHGEEKMYPSNTKEN